MLAQALALVALLHCCIVALLHCCIDKFVMRDVSIFSLQCITLHTCSNCNSLVFSFKKLPVILLVIDHFLLACIEPIDVFEVDCISICTCRCRCLDIHIDHDGKAWRVEPICGCNWVNICSIQVAKFLPRWIIGQVQVHGG